MTERQILIFTRSYAAAGFVLGIGAIAFIPWYLFHYGPAMLTWILLGIGGIVLLPIFVFAALQVLSTNPGNVG